jgi:pentatricopeptide repeat protein
MLAAYHNRVTVLKWLHDNRGLQLWGDGYCGVCVECVPPQALDDEFQLTPCRGKEPHSTRCPSNHVAHPLCYVFEAAIAGDSSEVLLFLMQHRDLFVKPWLAVLQTSLRPLWSIFIDSACRHGNLEFAKRVYSRISSQLSPGVYKTEVSRV